MKKPLLVVVDIGNTSSTLGLCQGRRVLNSLRVETTLREATAIQQSLRRLVGGRKADGAVLCSVVPAVNPLWALCIRDALAVEALLVEHTLDFGIPITYPKPESIGADRLADACAAAHKFGTPVISADFGTALTFDIVQPKKGYVGGIIVPGLPLMFQYLADKTALLPRIEPGPTRGWVGRSTEQAMRIGARYGYRGMVREILNHLMEQMGQECPVCATGGYSGWVLRGLDRPLHHEPYLTLHGLTRLYELNRS